MLLDIFRRAPRGEEAGASPKGCDTASHAPAYSVLIFSGYLPDPQIPRSWIAEIKVDGALYSGYGPSVPSALRALGNLLASKGVA